MKKYILKSFLSMLLVGTCLPTQLICSAASTADGSAAKDVPAVNEVDINTEKVVENYFSENAAFWTVSEPSDYVKDGSLHLNSNSTSATRSVKYALTPAETFECEIRVKVEQNGGEQGFRIQRGGKRVLLYLYNEKARVSSATSVNYVSGYNIGEFNTFRFEVSGDNVMVYLNGEYQFTCQFTESSGADGLSFFVKSSGSAHSSVVVDYVKYSCDYDISIVSPSPVLSYMEGGSITLRSKVDETGSIPSVDYYINGTYVGTADASENYSMKWSAVKQGTYVIDARYGDCSAAEVTLNVEPASGTKTTVSDKSDITVGDVVTFSLNGSTTNVKAVTYLVNGTEYAANADGSLVYSSRTVGKLTACAKIVYNDGSYEYSEPTVVYASASTADNLTLQGSYIAEYTASEGAKITASDGVYMLDVTHFAAGITYLTADGSETYSVGLGDYRLQVDSGVCDVYYNGQFAVSFILPITDKANGFAASGVGGLKLSGLNSDMYKYSGSGTYDVMPEIGREYAVEFTLDGSRDFAVDMSDGAYTLSLTASGGSISALTALNGLPNGAVNGTRTSEADLTSLGTLKEGRHAYRVTVSNGLAQLFIDNKWAQSFRLPPSYSLPYIGAVGVSPVVIRETENIYIFEDSFDGAGELDSAAYYDIDGSLISSFEDGALVLTSGSEGDGEAAPGSLVSEFNAEDDRWSNPDITTFADGIMTVSTASKSSKNAFLDAYYSENFELEVRMRVASQGAENGFKYEFENNRIIAYMRADGTFNVKVADGEPKFSVPVDVTEWHTYKFVVTDSENCELFIDGVSVGTCKLHAKHFDNPVISVFVKSTDGTTPATTEVDHVRLTSYDPIDESEVEEVETTRTTSPVLLNVFDTIRQCSPPCRSTAPTRATFTLQQDIKTVTATFLRATTSSRANGR